MSQLGIVVIAKNVKKILRRGLQSIDVCMRIDERNRAQFVVDRLTKLLRHRFFFVRLLGSGFN